MTTVGIDVFSGNGTVDFTKAKTEDGVAFAFRKATEGVTYNDPGFATDWARIVQAGLDPGSYHFARQGVNSPQAEAAHYLAAISGCRGFRALDLEDQNDGLTMSQRAAWALTFLNLASADGTIPFLYTYHSWAFSAEFTPVRARYPLWIPLDAPGADPLVQSTHMIGTLGTLDVDTFAGSILDMRNTAGLTGSTPALPQPPLILGDTLNAVIYTDPAGPWAVSNGFQKHMLADGDPTLYAELGLLLPQYYDPHTFTVTPKWVPATLWNALPTV